MPEEDMILEEHFYPRSPCGERQRKAGPEGPAKLPFLSTLSLRRATKMGLRAFFS